MHAISIHETVRIFGKFDTQDYEKQYLNEVKVIDLGIILNTSKDLEIKIGLAEGWEDNIKIVINTNLSRNKYERRKNKYTKYFG